MAAWWVTFENRKPTCIDASSEGEARMLALDLTGCDPVDCDHLPYPADPRLNRPSEGTPSFCLSPENCKGRTCCPRNYSCVE
jgi:hypothetical protein